MKYEQALAFIHQTEKFGSKPGLERIRALLALMDDPQEKLRFIHLAGTNGKGSTAALLAAMLERAGYRTGMYISPYVTDFRERIRVNGRYIAKEELAAAVEALLPRIAELTAAGHSHPTEFELITAVGFAYFLQKGCDFVVLETGLGGRFDATNVISRNEAAVITSISYDHTAILGDTLDKIAFEKCGILKPGSVCITYPEQPAAALSVIARRAREEGLELVVPDLSQLQVKDSTLAQTRFTYRGEDYTLKLAGEHQVKNALCAIETVRALQRRGIVQLTAGQMREAIAGCTFAGRMEVVNAAMERDLPRIVFDGAHNLSGITALAAAMDRYFTGGRVHVLMGMLADKTYAQCIPKIAARASRFAALAPRSPRALPAAECAACAAPVCADSRAFSDFDQALCFALDGLAAGDTLLICGSLYLIADMRRIVFARLGTSEDEEGDTRETQGETMDSARQAGAGKGAKNAD